MSYFTQKIIASYVNKSGIKVIVRESLNEKNHWELRLEIPKSLHHLYERQTFVYEKRGHLYFGEDKETGRVRFFFYDKPSHGFGGSKYELKLIDGSTATLIGPWSSNSTCMNNAGFEPSMYVNIEGIYNMADHMTLKVINQLLLPLQMEAILIDNEPWIIRL